jgi:hypothetical protein
VKRPKRCWGAASEQHAAGCRRGRPLCRFRRKTNPKRRACFCPAYHFPHRFGGGLCGNPAAIDALIWGGRKAVA